VSTSRRWTLVFTGLAATVLLLVLVAASGWTWESFTPATCVATSCFCERARQGPIKQPANTCSNLGFVFVGLLIVAGLLGRGASDDDRPLLRPGARVAYGLTVAFLGWTSMFFHASLTLAGEWVDMLSMLLFTSLVVLVNVRRVKPMSQASVVAIYVVANTAFGWAMIATTMKAAIPIFVGLSFGILATDALVRRRVARTYENRWLAASVVCCLASFGIWILDKKGLVSSPLSLFQGHAVWHLGQAGTTGLLYRHYVAERAFETAPAHASAPRLEIAPT
jgi:hypothetical protein